MLETSRLLRIGLNAVLFLCLAMSGEMRGIAQGPITGTTATFQSLNNVQLCDQFSGTDAGFKIANCIAALPAGGGIADARGFGAGLQTISAQLDIGGTGKPVTLLINPATQFQCTESSSTHYCLRLWNGSHVRGEGTGGAGSAANFIAASGSNLTGLISNWPRNGTVEFFSIQNLTLGSSGGTISHGLLDLSGIFAGSYVRDVYTTSCGSGGSALYMTSPVSGTLNITSDISLQNDNFDCGNVSGAGPSVQLIDGAATSGFGSINFFETQIQHPGNGQPIEVIQGNGSDQTNSISHVGIHYETSTGPSTIGPYVQITDAHNIAFDHVNTSGPSPTAGSGIAISQTAANSVHDIFLKDWRFGVGLTNVVASTVTGIPNFSYVAGPDGGMSLESWSGLPSNTTVGGAITFVPQPSTAKQIIFQNTSGSTTDIASLGFASNNKFYISAQNGRTLAFVVNNAGEAWQIANSSSPDFLAVTDGVGNIGQPAGARPNNLYVKNSIASSSAVFSKATINGNLFVSGSIYKGADFFKIDHPLDPAGKYLSHSVVESSEMKNIYDGIAILDANGQAEIELPAWFEALNKDFRYQLTCIGESAPVFVAQEMHDNRFRIAGGKPGLKVSWLVTGVRHDSYAMEHPMQVEEIKPAKGK